MDGVILYFNELAKTDQRKQVCLVLCLLKVNFVLSANEIYGGPCRNLVVMPKEMYKGGGWLFVDIP